jgi:hypothetical protein
MQRRISFTSPDFYESRGNAKEDCLATNHLANRRKVRGGRGMRLAIGDGGEEEEVQVSLSDMFYSASSYFSNIHLYLIIFAAHFWLLDTQTTFCL